MPAACDACLFIVATPIGNLGDISARALDTLRSVAWVAAEDTRHSGRLLQHFGISTRMISYHDFSGGSREDALLEKLKRGESIALISDAGTPLISDPGYGLVVRAREAGIRVIPIPGPSALTAAISVAGLPSDRFIFEGFLAAKQSARHAQLQAVLGEERTLVFYESPHRILASLADMRDVFGGQRQITVCRELSKTFETIKSGTLEETVAWINADSDQQRGEFVLVVRGAAPAEDAGTDTEALRILRLLMEELPLKQAASLTARITGLKKNELYQRALALRDAAGQTPEF
jgi:16S rRNA (cytidine1402-2'-O)-methyltransferase